ncbi:MAG TPA: HdeD family acid-resistance protein [Polyangiaceae bacterium]|nr:HdeD family acid-resistance protein [Polyangiaceae bacterium]
MSFPLAQNWWSLVFRGALAVLFGVLTMAMPGLTLEVLVPLFGAYAFLDGALNLAGAYRSARDGERWRTLSLAGFVSVGAGLVAFLRPELSLSGLIYLLAVWALATGVLEIAADVELRKRLDREWLLTVGGVVSLAFGALLIASPSALTVGSWLGVYALSLGGLLLAVGLRLRGFTLDRERTSLRQPIEES